MKPVVGFQHTDYTEKGTDFRRIVCHIFVSHNLVLFTGWVMMTGQLLLFVIPVLMFGGFAFASVPAQDKYLGER